MEISLKIILILYGLNLCASQQHNATLSNSNIISNNAHNLTFDASKYPDNGYSASLDAKVVFHIQTSLLNHTYGRHVSRSDVYLFEYTYSKSMLESSALRLKVSSSEAHLSKPVMVVAKQERGALTFQVPLRPIFKSDNAMIYDQIQRTLCPVWSFTTDPNKNLGLDDVQRLSVDVSSQSETNVSFDISVESFTNFYLDYQIPQTIKVNPAAPQYFEFKFPEHVDSVIVHINSSDSLCSAITVQNNTCPVFDLESTMHFASIYQTMKHQSAITVTREKFPDGFYVMMIVLTTDLKCSGDYGPDDREKVMTIVVRNKISRFDLIMAIFLGLFFIAIVYAIVFGFMIVNNKHRRRDDKRMGWVESQSCLTASGNTASDFVNSARTSRIVRVESDDSLNQIGHTDNSSVTSIPSRPDMRHQRNISPEDCGILNIDENCPRRDAPLNNDSEPHQTYMFTKSWKAKESSNGGSSQYEQNKCEKFVKDKTPQRRRTKLNQMCNIDHYASEQNSLLSTVVNFIFYFVPVLQIVFEYLREVNEGGDQDMCYYNFLCSHRVNRFNDFNHVFSNIGYGLFGVLFCIVVTVRKFLYEREIVKNPHVSQLGVPINFSAYYTLGIALMMEGLLSASYHICPNRSNYQFDTSFMYIIAMIFGYIAYDKRHCETSPNFNSILTVGSCMILLGVFGGEYSGNCWWWLMTSSIHFMLLCSLSFYMYFQGRRSLVTTLIEVYRTNGFRNTFVWAIGSVRQFKYTSLSEYKEVTIRIRDNWTSRITLIIILTTGHFIFLVCGFIYQPR